jgi:hydrogenase maturation protein HypF
MSELKKASIHITGIVQGVGFRPFVYALATRLNLKGWVRNTSAGVDIEVDGDSTILESFLALLRSETPPLARMDSFEVTYHSPGGFTEFTIVHSATIPDAFQPISPDVSICTDCLDELFDPGNRRYRYPFINCTNCGPRFTIITDIPYDRPQTTMAGFPMCPDCAAEYSDPLDRRFHAQPIACPVCGPKIWLEMNGTVIVGERAISSARDLLINGKILAIKGLGGFHLACDATNAVSVAELRKRKLRVDKPFALMMRSVEVVKTHCLMSEDERKLLESHQRPIVILQRKPGSAVVEDVSPRQDSFGVMLPYTPMHYLLMEADGMIPEVLVMTSGNMAEEPIATANDEARERLAPLADAFLMNDRDIHVRCDDTVLRQLDSLVDTEIEKSKPYFLRRSRGFAPNPISLPMDVRPILATGGELKNTFCLTRERYAFISQHIGDMENYETLRSFETGVTHIERLFRIRPELIVHDLHPNYLSTRYALERAERDGLPILPVQHHHAHIASCMADNGLGGDSKVIGLSFDGTGYGTDGTIWGGEVLIADYAGFERRYHLAYFPLAGGDAAIRRPARTALSLLWALGIEWDDSLAPLQDLCAEERLALRLQLERGINTPLTSSLGRLFDAAAALSGVRQRVNYEAQAAMEFESALDLDETGEYIFTVQESVIDTKRAITALLDDARKGVPIPVLSARFHNGLVALTRALCDSVHCETGISVVALSGGVWQNMFFLQKSVRMLLRDGFEVLVHHNVPANDGGLSLGQALIGSTKL